MPEHTTTQCVLFPGIFERPVIAKFDQSQGSSDGGAVLLKAADRELGLITALAACLKDYRQEAKVRHEIDELLDAAGYGHRLWLRRCQRCRPTGVRPGATNSWSVVIPWKGKIWLRSRPFAV